jgi:hypothetical protein
MRHRLAGFTAGKQRGELCFLFSSEHRLAESQQVSAGFPSQTQAIFRHHASGFHFLKAR